MNQWFNTFFEEKGLDLEDTFEFTNEKGWNLMPYGVVVEGILSTTPKEKAAIKDVLVQIDFANGDIKPFLRHLGKAL